MVGRSQIGPLDSSSMTEQELADNLAILGQTVSDLRKIVEGFIPKDLDPNSSEYETIVRVHLDADDVRPLLNTMAEIIDECVFYMKADEQALTPLIEELRKIHQLFVDAVEKRV